MAVVYHRGLDRETAPSSYKAPSGIGRDKLGEDHHQNDLVANSHSAKILRLELRKKLFLA